TIEIHIGNVLAWADTLKDKRTHLERVVADDGPHGYALRRLQQVKRSTLRKELTDLRHFLTWAKAKGFIASLPPDPALPERHPGTRSGPQREAPVDISPVDAMAIIGALPERSARGGRGGDRTTVKGSFVVRDRFMFAWETGLRPSSIARLEMTRHWRRGDSFL